MRQAAVSACRTRLSSVRCVRHDWQPPSQLRAPSGFAALSTDRIPAETVPVTVSSPRSGLMISRAGIGGLCIRDPRFPGAADHPTKSGGGLC